MSRLIELNSRRRRIAWRRSLRAAPVVAMHPEQIKAAMRMKGITPAALADELGVANSTISQVISGRIESARIKQRISKIVGLPVATLWPPSDRVRLRRTKAEVERARAMA